MNAKVRAIYGKELRDLIRDRRTLFATAIIPIFIYPLLTLGMAEVSQMTKAKLDREEFSVAVLPGTSVLVEHIHKIARETPVPTVGIPAPEMPDARKPVKKAEPKKSGTAPLNGDASAPKSEDSGDDPDDVSTDTFKTTQFSFHEMSADAAREALAAGKIRAILILPASFEEDIAAQRDPSATVEYDQAERISLSAFARLRVMLERYESAVVKERLKSRSLAPNFLHPFTLETKNTAKAEKVGGSLLGGILPLFFVVMLMTGSLPPAIDLTAGEKERSTLETLMSAPVRPIEIITGKFLAVATLALANAVLNVASSAVSIYLLPLPASFSLHFPWAALPLTLVLLIPLAFLFSALLLMVSCFAANSKEAQAFAMPVFLIPTLGMALANMPGIELEGPLMIAPVVNVALLIKELFLFHGTAQHFAFVFVSTCFYAAGMIAMASRVFAREEVLFSAQGSLRLFLSRRFFKPLATPRPGDSLLVGALMFPLYFYSSLLLVKYLKVEQGKPLALGTFVLLVMIPQYILFLGGPLVVSKYLKANWKTTFQWNLPPPRAFLGALLVGISSWLVIAQLGSWLSYFWPLEGGDDPLQAVVLQLKSTSGGWALLLFLIALTPAICEEHLFRGFFQQGLGRKNKWFTIFLVGAVFGFFHIPPVFKVPMISLLGMVFAYSAFQTRSIWPGVVMHFLHNSLTTFGPDLFKFAEEKPIPGQPVEGLPMVLFLPALVVFALGLFILSRSKPREAG